MAQISDTSLKETLDTAANSIRDGDITNGRRGLERVLKEDPENVLALLWMSKCVAGQEEKLKCFKKVLEIDPSNRHALKGLRVFSPGQAGSTGGPCQPSCTGAGE